MTERPQVKEAEAALLRSALESGIEKGGVLVFSVVDSGDALELEVSAASISSQDVKAIIDYLQNKFAAFADLTTTSMH